MGQVCYPRRTRPASPGQQAHHHRASRRGLQPARRQMEHLVRHGRELHGGGGGDVGRSSLPGVAVQRTASLPLAYDPAIHRSSKKMDTRVKPAYDDTKMLSHHRTLPQHNLRSQGRHRFCGWRNPVMRRSGLTAALAPGTVRSPSAGNLQRFCMFSIASLWIPFTLVAALGQVARNAMQRSLTGPLGTWGATNIRFLFGFPFSILFFAIVVTVTGDRIPWPTASFWPWLLLGPRRRRVPGGRNLGAWNCRSSVWT